jgi:hypothetical protein
MYRSTEKLALANETRFGLILNISDPKTVPNLPNAVMTMIAKKMQ